MFRKRNKFSSKLRARRNEFQAEHGVMAIPRAEQLPALRREIIVIDHDFGLVQHHVKLFRTGRVDCYRVEVDGLPWKDRVGWSRALEVLRKAFVRVGAAR